MISNENESSYNADEVCKKIHPSRYLKTHLEKGTRPYGNRKHFSYRQVVANVNVVKSCGGSSIVKIGNTTLICGINYEPTTPSRKYPKKGLVDINCKLSEHCNVTNVFKNKVVQLRQCVSLLQRLFIGLNIVDLDTLCIAESELVWLLRVHLVCVDYDGGFWDAAVLAMYSALKSLKLPKINYDFDAKSFRVDYDETSTIPIGTFPCATTFGIFQEFVIADPNREEEELCASFLTVVTENDDVKIVQKRGGTIISDTLLNECLKTAASRYKLMQKLIS